MGSVIKRQIKPLTSFPDCIKRLLDQYRWVSQWLFSVENEKGSCPEIGEKIIE